MKGFFTTWYVLAVISFLPTLTLAVDYIPLVGIPGLNDAGNMTTGNYVNALYILSISIAAFLAVARLIFAGVKYIATDIVPGKEEAKKDIKNALIGLLVVIGAVLILNTINPQLTNLDALDDLEEVRVPIKDIRVVADAGDGTTTENPTTCPTGSTLVRTPAGSKCTSIPSPTNPATPAPTKQTTPTSIVLDACGAVGITGADTTLVRCNNVNAEDVAITPGEYLFYEPAEYGLPASSVHNQPAKVISYIGNSNLVIERDDGTRYRIHCNLIRPLPRQCI